MSKKNIKELEQKIAELTEALQRERADSINLRRRVEEERQQMGNTYKAMIVRDVLPIIDNCERLLEHISTHSEDSPLKEGTEKIVKQAQKVLADLGVERIKTIGKQFDPHLHEAVHMDLPSEASAKEGEGDDYHEIISEELQAGYKIGDEVIRPAMVKVKREKK